MIMTIIVKSTIINKRDIFKTLFKLVDNLQLKEIDLKRGK